MTGRRQSLAESIQSSEWMNQIRTQFRRRKEEDADRPKRGGKKKEPYVLVVSESMDQLTKLGNREIEDENEQQIYAYNASRRLSRDNIQAIGLLTSNIFDIGVRFDPDDPFYDRNISLYRRNILKWRASLSAPRIKKGKVMREIPLAATEVYMRRITKSQRFCRFFLKKFRLKKVTYMTTDVLSSESLVNFIAKEKNEVESPSLTSLEVLAHEKKRRIYFDSYI